MLVCILQGNEAGAVKDLDDHGGRHAVATNFARLATGAEKKEHAKEQKATAKALKGTQSLDEARAARKLREAKEGGSKETREAEGAPPPSEGQES